MKLNNIYFGDCLDVMKAIHDKSIDMIFADLPYGITACHWDIIIPFDELWSQFERIITDKGAMVFTASQPFTSKLVMSNLKLFKYCWYWEKERLTNISQVKRRAGKTVEEVVVFYKKQPTYNPQMITYTGKKRTNKVKNGKLGVLTDKSEKKVKEYIDTGVRYPTQVLKFKRDILKTNLHPTQKPVALIEYLIKTYTNNGDTVLDPVAGSGTTGVACKNIGRNFILIEKQQEYIDVINKRLSVSDTKNL